MGVIILSINAKKILKNKRLIFPLVIVILSILLLFSFPGIYFLIAMIVFDRLLIYIQKNKHIKIGLENVTIVSLILGQVSDYLFVAIAGTLIMMMITKIRDVKMSFGGIFIDGFFWIVFAVISSHTSPENFFLVGLLLIIARFIIQKFMLFTKGGSFEDLPVDFINLFYHIAFIKVFAILFLV